MASNINTVLADCEDQSKQLIAEISKYHAAGVLGDKAAKSLEKLCDVQKETGIALEKALEATRKISTVEILANVKRLERAVWLTLLIALLIAGAGTIAAVMAIRKLP